MDEPELPEIIVVCYGNICRSPMGEVLLQRALDERLGPGAVHVTSAGIAADDWRPPSQGTIKAMAARGIDVRNLRSSFLSAEWARKVWRIYCMESYQVAHVQRLIPESADKVMLFGGEEIDDPLGSSQEAYDFVAAQLERLIPLAVDDIAAALETSRDG